MKFVDQGKFIINLSIALFAMFCLPNSQAGGSTQSTLVKHILYYEGHVGALIITNTAMINPDGCQRSDYYILRNSHPMYKEMTALLLAAQVSGQPLSIDVNGCVQGLPSVVNISSTK